ncbi:hypothetical protein QMP26_32290 [Enterocloster clostridioformis]
MFDIEKARARGIDERSIKIMQDINENNRKEESCRRHEFEHEKNQWFAEVSVQELWLRGGGFFRERIYEGVRTWKILRLNY